MLTAFPRAVRGSDDLGPEPEPVPEPVPPVPASGFRRARRGSEAQRDRAAAGRGPAHDQRPAGGFRDAPGDVQAQAGRTASGQPALGGVDVTEARSVVGDAQPGTTAGPRAEPDG